MDQNVRQAVPEDCTAIARVHVDSWKTAYRGIVPEDYLARLSYTDREATWSQAIGNPQNIVLVAGDTKTTGNTVIGFVSGGANRTKDTIYAGELYAIYILKEYRGKGIGRNLVLSLVQRFVDCNINSMFVWVLTKNPYAKFYDKLGGQQVGSQQIRIGGTSFEEIAYGWKDLSLLLEMQQKLGDHVEK